MSPRQGAPEPTGVQPGGDGFESDVCGQQASGGRTGCENKVTTWVEFTEYYPDGRTLELAAIVCDSCACDLRDGVTFDVEWFPRPPVRSEVTLYRSIQSHRAFVEDYLAARSKRTFATD